MFARATAVSLLALPLLAAATAVPRDQPASQCNVNDLQCCNSVQSANSGAVSLLAALLGIVLGPITGQVGVTCSPITVIGVSGTSCNAQPVCCTGNTFSGGLLALGCSPVNLNL